MKRRAFLDKAVLLGTISILFSGKSHGSDQLPEKVSPHKNHTTIDSIDNLRKFKSTKFNELVFVTGYYEDSLGEGGGFYRSEQYTNQVEDGGLIILSDDKQNVWRNVDNQSAGLDARLFGVIASKRDVTDNINSATMYATENRCELILPAGYIRIDGVWLCSSAGFSCRGQGPNNTFIYGSSESINKPIFQVKSENWDADSDPSTSRLNGFKISNLCFVGKIENTKDEPSGRDAMSLHGIGFDFEISSVYFYNIGHRAIYAEDIWDGEIHNCKFHECGQSQGWKSRDGYHQALVFNKKHDCCNAIRITSCHFEHLKRGAIYINDFSFSFFLTNNKFEAVNQDKKYPTETPILIGKNSRCITINGGFITLTQQDKNMHYLVCNADIVRIMNVAFIAPKINDGAAVLDISPGKAGIGAIISSHFDVRGDLDVYPIIAKGDVDFSGSTIKVYKKGKLIDGDPKLLQGARVKNI